VGDPRVRAALAHPGPDLIELGLQRPARHRRRERLPIAPLTSVECSERLGIHGRSDFFIAWRGTSKAGGLYERGTEAEMLVLTRKSNQSIMIGDDIEVSVLAIMGEKVRIGIEAPRSIPVFRKEVYLEIRQDASPEETRREVDQALEKLKSPPTE
jgi:carbon storage regulator